MAHTYREFYHHFVWGTKLREPFVTAEVEPAVYGYIRARCTEIGVFVYALNGMPDHVHLVCSVPPRIAVAEFIDKIKGASSHYVNHVPEKGWTLYCQTGYGGLTFAKKDLERIVRYVENQKQHHASGTLWPSLERLEDVPDQAAERRSLE